MQEKFNFWLNFFKIDNNLVDKSVFFQSLLERVPLIQVFTKRLKNRACITKFQQI